MASPGGQVERPPATPEQERMKRLRMTFCLLALGLAGWSLGQSPPGGGAAEERALRRESPAGRATTRPERPGGPLRMQIAARAIVPLTDKQREQVRQFLRAEQPDLFQALEAVQDKDPKRYAWMLDQAGRSAMFLMELQQDNPQLYGLYKEEMQLGRKIGRLTEDIRKAPDEAARSELVNQLREELARRFDVSQKRQKLQVAQFKRQVERLEAMLQQRLANRDQIIERELRRILNWHLIRRRFRRR